MMNFSNAIAPQLSAASATGADTPLATGKGFDQDQIAKLKDACGVHNAQHIPAIWPVIQATKGKSMDTYPAHLSKFIESWCRAHHINRDKSLFLRQSSSRIWWPCVSTQVARWRSFTWWHGGCQCWHVDQ